MPEPKSIYIYFKCNKLYFKLLMFGENYTGIKLQKAVPALPETNWKKQVYLFHYLNGIKPD